MTTFVFLHVGSDRHVELFLHSIRKTNPNARVIQCTDRVTRPVDGNTEIYRHDGDTSNLMTFRLESFSALNLKEPAFYLDTDMLVMTELRAGDVLSHADVACCERSFHRDALLNISFRGMDLSEYKGKNLGEIYPILAAFTVSRSFDFWDECLARLRLIDKKFSFWFGDQEAMRDVVRSGRFNVTLIPEAKFACLPEFAQGNFPAVLHFKGARRKAWMIEIFNKTYHV